MNLIAQICLFGPTTLASLTASPAFAKGMSGPLSWALDRLDQDALPLDGVFRTPDGASSRGVTVYVVDGGVFADHPDFGGRVTAAPDFSGAVPLNQCARVPSHGTHTAGLVGSRTFGVAKGANLVDVRVLGCDGKTTKERMEDALEWIVANARKPAVVNMSVGSGNADDAIDAAILAVVDAGIPIVLSAGNAEADACTHYPSNVREAIVVAASSDHDVLAPFSNRGPCVDIIAPGWNVLSTMAKHRNASGSLFGTSEAAPLVAGAAALYLGKNPGASPRDVEEALVRSSTRGVIKDSNSGLPLGKVAASDDGTPNALLNVTRLLAP